MKKIMLMGILILAGGCGESPVEPVKQEQSGCAWMVEDMESLPDGFWFGFDEEILETVKQECA